MNVSEIYNGKKYFIAQIEWVEHEKGGRKRIPPKNTRYCPLIRICDKGQNTEWSIDFICPDFEGTNMITFSFLVDDAPVDLLEVNKSYSIYEGARLVASVQILNISQNDINES